MRGFVIAAAAVCFALGSAPACPSASAEEVAASATSSETYDLMFKSGALDTLAAAKPTAAAADAAKEKADALVYEQVIAGAGEKRPNGAYTLGLRFDPGEAVGLTLHQGDKSRNIGDFPASVGNPIIMYFMESALADVAALSGGSPFYLRNRIKEALLKPATITPVTLRRGDHEIAARKVTITPFANDKASDRLGRFTGLSLSVVVADGVPGWYQSLEAAAPAGAEAATQPAYSHAITLKTANGEG